MLLEVLIAIGAAFCLAYLLAVPLGWRRPGYETAGWPAAFWFLFALLMMASWVGGLWLSPVGPRMYGIYWFPFMAVALLVALVVASVSPPPGEDPGVPGGVTGLRRATILGVNCMLWLLLALLLFLGLYQRMGGPA
ncbi:MAG: hypothetical protein AB7N76_10725 [Planctomycetota bacterium]